MAWYSHCHQLTKEEWDAANCKEELGMDCNDFQEDPDEKTKLGEAVSILGALDLFPFMRLLNQSDAQAKVGRLLRKLRLKRANTAYVAYKVGLKVLKANPQNLAMLIQSGVFSSIEDFKQAEADLSQLLGSNDKLVGDPGLEERATRLLVACIGLVLENIDRKLARLPAEVLATPATNKTKTKSIKTYVQENEKLRSKLEKRSVSLYLFAPLSLLLFRSLSLYLSSHLFLSISFSLSLSQDARGARPKDGHQRTYGIAR